ncbi:uncharacterized protein LOC135385154 [Ornithodoros turicata]|uniref:uncharacterized protein LOC135385154 n=1 Tax=Ornithodoros turicata TaxID=34597 RepID=UPI003138CEB0
MNDVVDGRLYRSIRNKVCSEADITVTMNSDGSPAFNSSNYSIWPIQLTINELPHSLRTSNVLTAALWYGKEHPNMSLFLDAFVKKLNILSEEGIKWTSVSREITSKVFCVNCCADAPARAAMQHMKQFNDHYGCDWCLHPGFTLAGSSVVKYKADLLDVHDRTHATMVEDMKAAVTRGPTNGVKGPSPLINLQGFDIVWGFTPDYMHCVLLGVTRQFLQIWLESPGEPYYIGRPRDQAIINAKLCSIKPPSNFSRPPRSLSTYRNWKASEFQKWLLYYSLPCVEGVLNSKYLGHFRLLVCAVYLLLKQSVCMREINRATKLVVEFVLKTQKYYGESQMTFNVHQLLHLPKSVVNFGPLWSHSCFCFESNMGTLLRLIKSSKGVPLQISSTVMMQNQTRKMLEHACSSTKEYSESLHGEPSLFTGTHFLGSGQEFDMTPHLSLINRVLGYTPSSATEYSRVSIGGFVFHSMQYSRPKKTGNTVLLLSTQRDLVRIEHIIRFNDSRCCRDVYTISRRLTAEIALATDHIHSVDLLPVFSMYSLDSSATPCVYIDFRDKKYVCQMPSMYERS